MTENKPIKIFFSYAHEDEALRNELAKHLSSLQRQGIISSWHDRQIIAGDGWKDEIDMHLNTSQIILLLISSDFMASDYCNDVELRRALERDDKGEARVIPVILRPVDWKSAPFGKFQALPKDAKPITKWDNLDDAFVDVVNGIRKVIAELRTSSNNENVLQTEPVPSKAELRAPDNTENALPAKIAIWGKSKVFVRKNSRFFGAVIIFLAILAAIFFVGESWIGSIRPTLTATGAVTTTPSQTPPSPTKADALVATGTPWLCLFSDGDDEVILRSLIDAEAAAVEKEDIETINLIFMPTAIVADASGTSGDFALARYAYKFKEEMHQNIQHSDFRYDKLTKTDAVVTTKVTGEWYDGENWRTYGGDSYDNRWEFEKVDGCWRISGFTYNLSSLTPVP